MKTREVSNLYEHTCIALTQYNFCITV